MAQESDLDKSKIIIGKIGAPHGVQGWVHVQSFMHPAENILNYKKWFFLVENQWEERAVLAIRRQGKQFIAHLEGINNRDGAVQVRNLEISIEKSLLPSLKPGEYYWADLIGLAVINENGIILGTVKNLLETGSNDVLVVQEQRQGQERGQVKGQREHLIPYIDEYVLAVDLESRQITVFWDPEF